VSLLLSVLLWVVVGLVAWFVGRTAVKHPLAAVLIAVGASWATPSATITHMAIAPSIFQVIGIR
jgi:hypothetical protein